MKKQSAVMLLKIIVYIAIATFGILMVFLPDKIRENAKQNEINRQKIIVYDSMFNIEKTDDMVRQQFEPSAAGNKDSDSITWQTFQPSYIPALEFEDSTQYLYICAFDPHKIIDSLQNIIDTYPPRQGKISHTEYLYYNFEYNKTSPPEEIIIRDSIGHYDTLFPPNYKPEIDYKKRYEKQKILIAKLKARKNKIDTVYLKRPFRPVNYIPYRNIAFSDQVPVPVYSYYRERTLIKYKHPLLRSLFAVGLIQSWAYTGGFGLNK